MTLIYRVSFLWIKSERKPVSSYFTSWNYNYTFLKHRRVCFKKRRNKISTAYRAKIKGKSDVKVIKLASFCLFIFSNSAFPLHKFLKPPWFEILIINMPRNIPPVKSLSSWYYCNICNFWSGNIKLHKIIVLLLAKMWFCQKMNHWSGNSTELEMTFPGKR